MALRERYIKDANGEGTAAALDDSVYGNQSFQEMKARLHKAIITKLDLTKLNTPAPERIHAEVSRLAEGLLLAENVPLSTAERDRLVGEVHHEQVSHTIISRFIAEVFYSTPADAATRKPLHGDRLPRQFSPAVSLCISTIAQAAFQYCYRRSKRVVYSRVSSPPRTGSP